ncbi:MAG: isoprenylcysteine carboxylmethyltransferase family protein [Phycisphaerales bacterium]|nr:MAG: isoprenylcysteine carboxylmethyltransferase family protein [Phycisphaerales bacterium]
MQAETLCYRVAVISLVALLSIIKILYILKATGGGHTIRPGDDAVDASLAVLVLMLWLGCPLIYLLFSQWITWASFYLPPWVRWGGFGLGLVGTFLTAWSHHTLGRNFSPVLEIDRRHTLVLDGPYRWVRHPIYASIYVIDLALLLLSANFLVGPPSAAVLGLLLARRIPREEALMVNAFGDAYRAYMKRTGALLPRPRGESSKSEDTRR